MKNSLSVLQENRNKNYDFERQKNVKWSSSNHLALSPLELNESGFMSRYWHFLITHSLKRQGSHEQDESKINARWMLKVISDAPNRTESRSPRFCAQGIRSYGVSGILYSESVDDFMRRVSTCVIISHSLFFTTLFKKPMKPQSLEFFEQQKTRHNSETSFILHTDALKL